MKYLFLIFTAFVLVQSAFGQNDTDRINYGNRIGPGTLLISGTVQFEKIFPDNKSLNIALNTELLLSKRMAVALGIGYVNQDYLNNSFGVEDVREVFSVIPGFTVYGNVRYGWLQPTFGVSLPIGIRKKIGVISSVGNIEKDSPFISISGIISPGLNIYLSKKIALTASLGFIKYTALHYDHLDEKKTSFGIGLSPSDLSFGLVFVLEAD